MSYDISVPSDRWACGPLICTLYVYDGMNVIEEMSSADRCAHRIGEEDTVKTLVVVALSFCLATLVHAAQGNAGVVPTHELYSWQDAKGGWNFSLLYTTDRQKTAEEVLLIIE